MGETKLMESIENMQKELKEKLSEKRYKHSLGVMKKAGELAKIYKIDTYIAELTGLAHDITKEMTNDEKLEYAQKHNFQVDEIEKSNIGLLHAKIGADIAKNKYGFTEEMQNAIKYHTVTNPDMDLLAKIIFVSDKIEENREYEGVQELRKLAKSNIDACILEILNYTIKENIDKGKLVHPNSILTRNKLLIH